jgi:AcrR family transcriptional regulator
VEASRELYGAVADDPVTIDAVMQAAGLAKGTFYVHYQDLAELEAEVGSALVSALDERLQPARLAVADPLTRIATAVLILLRDLAAVPSRARLAARAAVNFPDVDRGIQSHLKEDLAAVQAAGRLALGSKELAARVVSAIVVQASRDLGQGRLRSNALPDIARAILRAIGCTPADASAHVDQAARTADRFGRHLTQSGGSQSRHQC